jgi:hypothetical protein
MKKFPVTYMKNHQNPNFGCPSVNTTHFHRYLVIQSAITIGPNMMSMITLMEEIISGLLIMGPKMMSMTMMTLGEESSLLSGRNVREVEEAGI